MNDLNNKSISINVLGNTSKDIFVGREDEIACAEKEYAKMLLGGFGGITIVGASGVGKTYFAEQFLKNNKSKITYLNGKCRKHDTQSIRAVNEIINQIISYFLILPIKSYSLIKEEIKNSLGADIDILLSICPRAKKMFGEQNSNNINDLEKLRYRARNVISKVISIASIHLFPLVMFLDDIQWANELTLSMIKPILSKSQSFNLLLIVSYREAETDKTMQPIINLLNKNTEVINITNLDLDFIKEYLIQYFDAEIENVNNIASVIHTVTEGKPLFVKDLIDSYVEKNAYDCNLTDGKCTIDIDKIKSAGVHNNYETTLKNKIESISPIYTNLIDIIACLNGKVPYDLLLFVSGLTKSKLDRQIKYLAKLSLIIDSIDINRKRQIYFTHDMLHKIAFERLSKGRRSELSFHLAHLLAETDEFLAEDKDYLISSYILSCSMDILLPQAKQWVNILYEAGQKDMRIASFGSALKTFNKALELLNASECKDDSLDVGIRLSIAMGMIITERGDECKEIIDTLLLEYSDKEIVIEIKKKQRMMFECTGEYQKVIETGIETLDLLGHKIGKIYFIPRIVKGLLLYTKRRIDKLLITEESPESGGLEIVEILQGISPSAKMVDDKMLNMLLLDSAIVSIEDMIKTDLIGYCAYCLFLYTILKQYKLASHLEKVIIELLESQDEINNLSMTYFMLGAFLHHYTNPMEESLKYQQLSIDAGLQIGEFMYSGYSVAIATDTMNAMGLPVDKRIAYVKKYENDYANTNYTVRYNLAVYKQHLEFLKYGKEWELKEYEDVSLEEKWMENYPLVERYYLDNKIDKAYEIVVQMQDLVSLLDGYTYTADVVFYCALIRISMHHKLSGNEKRINLRNIKKLKRRLAEYVRIYKYNHYARYMFVVAEYKNKIENKYNIQNIYFEGIEHASKQNNIKLEAIGNMTLAVLYKNNIKMQKFFASEIVRLFKKMDANYLSTKYARMYGIDMDEGDIDRKDANGTVHIQDRTSVEEFLTSIHEANESESIIRLIGYITQNTCITRCMVVYAKDNKLFIKYDKQKGRNAVTHSTQVNINQMPGIVHRMLRYSARSKSEAHITTKVREDIFAKEPCIAANDMLCVYCLPVMFHDVLIAVIYLENQRGDIQKGTINFVKAVSLALTSKIENINGVNIKEVFAKEQKQEILSKREYEIIELLSQGYSNQKISQSLNITTGTTKNHLSNIYQKLDAANRTEAIRKARDLNILY